MRANVAFASIVPTMLRRLLDAGTDLSSYRAILVGGAELPADLRARAADTVVETYGLTESCGGVIYDGRPVGDVGVRLGADDGIELSGPTLMSSYRSDPAGTAAAFTRDGWLVTGDIGGLRDDGRLRVAGRADDLITSGGEKVWPSVVEAAVGAHPKVREVVAAGSPDPEWGQRVVALGRPRRSPRPAHPAGPPAFLCGDAREPRGPARVGPRRRAAQDPLGQGPALVAAVADRTGRLDRTGIACGYPR